MSIASLGLVHLNPFHSTSGAHAFYIWHFVGQGEMQWRYYTIRATLKVFGFTVEDLYKSNELKVGVNPLETQGVHKSGKSGNSTFKTVWPP